VCRCASVVRHHDLLSNLSDFPNGLIQEIHSRFLIRKEGRIESGRALVTTIGSDDGEATRQCRHIARRNIADRQRDFSVEATAALHQEATVPVLGQCNCKTNGVRPPILAGTRVDHAINSAVCGQSSKERRTEWCCRSGPLRNSHRLRDGHVETRRLK